MLSWRINKVQFEGKRPFAGTGILNYVLDVEGVRQGRVVCYCCQGTLSILTIDSHSPGCFLCDLWDGME